MNEHTFCQALLASLRSEAKALGIVLPRKLSALRCCDGKQYFVEGAGGTVREYIKADCAWDAKATYISRLIEKHKEAV